MDALVLEDGNYNASMSAVRALGRLGHRVTVASTFETPAGASRWCNRAVIAPSPRDAGRYLDFLARSRGGGSFDLALVCDDSISVVVSYARDDLTAGPDFLLAPRESVDIARNKASAQRFAASLGIPTPVTITLDDASSLEAASRLGFPLVVKDDMGSGGRHVRYAADAETLRRAYEDVAARATGRPIAQEYIPGEGYLTQVLSDHGRLVAICSHRKYRQFPPAGGVTSKGVTVDEPELDAQVERIFTALHWHGPAKADFKRDPRDGRFKLMELDPRLSTTLEIAEAAGANIVELCCMIAAGERVEPRLAYRKEVAVRYVARDLLCLALRPELLPHILIDAVDPRVRSDFDWRDLRGNCGLVRRGVWHFEGLWREGRLGTALAASPGAGPLQSRGRGMLGRIAPALIVAGLLGSRVLYRGLKHIGGVAGRARGTADRASREAAGT
jgi:predicted ATP-grasp superfamily ATP-dependent carboligase